MKGWYLIHNRWTHVSDKQGTLYIDGDPAMQALFDKDPVLVDTNQYITETNIMTKEEDTIAKEYKESTKRLKKRMEDIRKNYSSKRPVPPANKGILW